MGKEEIRYITRQLIYIISLIDLERDFGEGGEGDIY